MAEFFSNLTFACWWDIPALILLIVVGTFWFVKRRKLNAEKKQLESQLSSK